MKMLHLRSIPLAAALCVLLLFSCTSTLDDMPSPPPLDSSSSFGISLPVYGFCIYSEMQKCFPGSYTSCPVGGELGNFCPFSTPSSSSNSSPVHGQSSSSAALEYGYCVFAASGMCLPGPVSVCPPGGVLSNVCLYGSSSSVASSSSSLPSYNYCILANNTCLAGPFNASTCTGQLSNSCPYASSSSVISIVPSSSSIALPSSSSVVPIVPSSSSIALPSSSSIAPPPSSSSSIITYTLACGSVPAFGTAGSAITPPTVTCNGATVSVAAWSGTPSAPAWSNPVAGTYSGIRATATCGTGNQTANCSGTLTVNAVVPSSSSEYTGGSCNASDYGTVIIGSQTWMKKNWGCYVAGSKCYNNDPANCATYGRLYDWSTAMEVCPTGWHLPSNADWDKLLKFVDNANGSSGIENFCSRSTCYYSYSADRYLKAINGWNSCGTGGSYSYKCEDTYGFSALPGGYSLVGDFSNVGVYGYWWSSFESLNGDYAYYRSMHYTENGVEYSLYGKEFLFSVRCVKD